MWTSAFASVGSGRARMRTFNGEVMIDFEVAVSADHGTVDWRTTLHPVDAWTHVPLRF